MIKTKVSFLEGRLFSQSELFECFFNCFDWLDKSRPSKKLLCFDYVNKAISSWDIALTSGWHLMPPSLYDINILAPHAPQFVRHQH